MKKIYLLLLVICSGIQINGMDSQENSEIAIDGLNKRDAQAIFDSLARLSNAFGKEYDPHASQGTNRALELSPFVQDLKNKTSKFPSLSHLVSVIEQLIQHNDGKSFWTAVESLKSLLRPTFRLPDTRKPKPVGWYEALKNYVFGKQKKSLPSDVPAVRDQPESQGYVARVVGSVTGAVSSFYNWLFSGQGVQVE